MIIILSTQYCDGALVISVLNSDWGGTKFLKVLSSLRDIFPDWFRYLGKMFTHHPNTLGGCLDGRRVEWR